MARGSTTVMLDLYGCRAFLTEGERLLAEATHIVEGNGMRVRISALDVWEENKAFNLWLSLEESHVGVETWPDEGFAKVTVDLCNYTRDNSEKAVEIALAIARLFNPDEAQTKRWMTARGPEGPKLGAG